MRKLYGAAQRFYTQLEYRNARFAQHFAPLKTKLTNIENVTLIIRHKSAVLSPNAIISLQYVYGYKDVCDL